MFHRTNCKQFAKSKKSFLVILYRQIPFSLKIYGDLQHMTLPVLFFYGFAFVGFIHSIIFSFLALKNKRAADLLISLYLLAQSLIIFEYVFFGISVFIKNEIHIHV